MDTYRKLLILVIIILFSYILYQLLNQRQKDGLREGLVASKTGGSPTLPIINTDEPAAVNEVKNMKVTGWSGVKNYGIVHPTETNLYMSQYIVKGSYNSASSGNYISISALDYVVSRGCRFLDFEVFLQNSHPIIATSTDKTYQTISSKNSVTLFDVLKHIASSYGPNSQVSPNPADPLFIQLRIKSKDNSIYDLIASVIQNAIANEPGNNLYVGPQIAANTLLSNLMGKIVIVVDQTVAPYYNSSESLLALTNLASGSTSLNSNSYHALLSQKTNPPTIINLTAIPNSDRNNHVLGINTTNEKFQMVRPDYLETGQPSNPAYSGFITKYGVNIILMKFYQPDSNLKEYEKFFTNNGTAIIQIKDALNYITGGGKMEPFSDYTSEPVPNYTSNKHISITKTEAPSILTPVKLGSILSIFTPNTIPF